MYIHHEYFDFFYYFIRFARNIDHKKFQQDLDQVGHGKGDIRRIKDLLYNYPEIQQRWYEYKDNNEQEIVK
ncbi:MAG: hypothetical protein COA82_09440 [Alkaliphilus sp.]|nr:MAG: hypothetical protein COA82_09440 [Alkaliphilus sp.]